MNFPLWFLLGIGFGSALVMALNELAGRRGSSAGAECSSHHYAGARTVGYRIEQQETGLGEAPYYVSKVMKRSTCQHDYCFEQKETVAKPPLELHPAVSEYDRYDPDETLRALVEYLDEGSDEDES